MRCLNSKHRAALAQALTELHRLLTKEQRAALIEEVFHRAASAHASMPLKFAPAEEYPFAHLLADLGLTCEQSEAIATNVRPYVQTKPNADEVDAMLRKLEERTLSFVGDTFDAAAVIAPPAEFEQNALESRTRLANILNVILSELDERQRERFAERFVAHTRVPPPPPR